MVEWSACPLLTAHEIATYLNELGGELAARGVTGPVRILIIGGAFMVTQVGNRGTTKAIDIVLVDVPALASSPWDQPFRDAIRAVAARHTLAPNWLNDVAADALRNAGPLPAGRPWRHDGPLVSLVPDDASILATKLLAGRTVDLANCHVLCQRLGVTARAQARQIVDQYVTDDQLKQVQDVDGTIALLLP